jgi:hypothetical protein
LSTTVADVRRSFLDEMSRQGAESVAEHSLLMPPGSEPMLVGAAVVPYAERFLRDRAHERLYAWAQRTVSFRKVRETGHYPLAHPLEVALSFVATGHPPVETGLALLAHAMHATLGVRLDDLMYRVPAGGPWAPELERYGVPSDHVVVWDRDLAFGWGAGRDVDGGYVFPYLPYRGGIVPLGAVGFDCRPGRYLVDGSLFLERLGFVAENARTPFEATALVPLVDALTGTAALDPSPVVHRTCASHLRTIRMMIADGVVPAAGGAGHELKMLIRTVAAATSRPWPPPELDRLMRAAEDCLDVLGYRLPRADRPDSDLSAWLSAAQRQLAQAEERVAARLVRSRSRIVLDDVRQETGLPVARITALADAAGVPVVGAAPPEAYSIRNQGFPFDLTNPLDARDLLVRSERPRMSRAR